MRGENSERMLHRGSYTTPICIPKINPDRDDHGYRDKEGIFVHDLGLSYRRDGDLMMTGRTGELSSAGLQRRSFSLARASRSELRGG